MKQFANNQGGYETNPKQQYRPWYPPWHFRVTSQVIRLGMTHVI
jgi:hypothetical protein